MNILITNDDGIDSERLARLARTAKKYGEIWVIAPDGQRSAMSHSISLREPVTLYPVPDFPVEGVHAYKSTGTPGDCVRHGTRNILKGGVDLVLSGINAGYNSGSDIQYSATVGAAMEGAYEGFHSIALSESFEDCHEVTDAYLEKILDQLIGEKLPKNQIWNVNFPSCKLSELKGILWDRAVAENAFYTDSYEEAYGEDGSIKLTIQGTYGEDAPAGTDFRAIVDHYISISKLVNIHAC